MRICGLQKLTLLDYPGHTACTVFLGGCNFRCPFCHNASLVLRPEQQPELDAEDVFAFLRQRAGLLDGVAITGGEPLLQPELPAFLQALKKMGFSVKLDTNGSHSTGLKAVLEAGLVDYVAMDIKNAPERYAETCGVAEPQIEEIFLSAALLMEGRIPYEFRTTVVAELHRPADLAAIGRWLAGAERYYLQSFVDSGDLIFSGLHPCSRDELEALLLAVRPFIPSAILRGAE